MTTPLTPSPLAFCFDMDGVLLNTEPLSNKVFQQAAGLQGYTFEEAQWQSLIGANMQSTVQSLNRWFPDMDAARFFADWCRLMLEHARRDGIPMMPGCPEVLHRLRARGMKLALCTSNAADVVAEYLQLAHMTDRFDVIVTGEMIAHGKPAPDIYLLGAEKLGIPPENCVGVEDSVNGIKAVRAAEMVSVMIPDMLPYTDALAPYVDYCMSSLHDLECTIFGQEKE